MARTAQPTVKRVLLGRELEFWRLKAKKSQGAAGKVIGKGHDVIGRLEEGLATIKAEPLERLLDAYDVDSAHREIIRAMHADSHKMIGWNTGYQRAYPEDLRLLVDLEQHATHIFISQCEIIPGLLQHEDYTRALIKEGRPMPQQVDEVIQAWQARQDILTKPNAPDVHVVLSESALRRRYASREVMAMQLNYLDALADRHRNLLLQILPFDGGNDHYSGTPPRFQILRVSSKGQSGHLRMVYEEGLREIRYRDDPRVVALHEDRQNQLAASALNPNDSRRFIRHIAGKFAADATSPGTSSLEGETP